MRHLHAPWLDARADVDARTAILIRGDINNDVIHAEKSMAMTVIRTVDDIARSEDIPQVSARDAAIQIREHGFGVTDKRLRVNFRIIRAV